VKAKGLRFIYWFAYYNTKSPSVRYRGYYALEFFKKEYGVGSYFVIPGYTPFKIFQFVKAWFSAMLFKKEGSLIIVQRVHSNFIYAGLLKLLVKWRKANTVYDLDDADYLEHPAETLFYFTRNCSAVSVGSNELLKNLSSGAKKITLNTSPVPQLGIIKQKKNSLFTIGWIGDFRGGHRERMLNIFFPALENLPFPVKLVLLGVSQRSAHDFLVNYFRSFINVQVEMPEVIDWDDEKSIQERIATFDIGIGTLQDNELQRSKSAFKIKQYLNNGIPVLSSDVPENNFFIEDGKNGFFCSSPEEFRQRMIEVYEMNHEDYRVLSANALATAPDFNLRKYCDNLQALYAE